MDKKMGLRCGGEKIQPGGRRLWFLKEIGLGLSFPLMRKIVLSQL